MPACCLRKRLPIPAGVWISVIALAIIVGLAFVSFVMQPAEASDFARMAVAVVFLIFLVCGHPLARQWAIFISVIAFLQASAVIALSTVSQEWSGFVFAMSAALGFLPVLVIAGLVPRRSKEYFDLRCPTCHSYEVRAASFLFNKLRCLKCKERWFLREDKTPVESFD